MMHYKHRQNTKLQSVMEATSSKDNCKHEFVMDSNFVKICLDLKAKNNYEVQILRYKIH